MPLGYKRQNEKAEPKPCPSIKKYENKRKLFKLNDVHPFEKEVSLFGFTLDRLRCGNDGKPSVNVLNCRISLFAEKFDIFFGKFVFLFEFEQKIRKGEFVEYEEVYAGSYYGTLQSEVERIWAKGHIILFDIDVKGGINIKRLYGSHALAVFIQPPSVEALKERLVKRGTDSPQAIERRVAKAEEELGYAGSFDRVIVNDSLECALREAEAVVETFYNE